MELQQWFLHCNSNMEKVRNFENNTIQFYKKLYDPKSNEFYNALSKPLMRGFYNKDKAKYNRQIVPFAIKGIIISAIMSVILFLLFPILQGFEYNSVLSKINMQYVNGKMTSSFMSNFWNGFKDWFSGRNVVKPYKGLGANEAITLLPTDDEISSTISVGLAIVLCLLLIVLVTTLFIVFKKYTFNAYCNRLAKQENELVPILEIIPPQFRSSEKMDVLAKIYFNEQSVGFNQALDICKDFVRERQLRQIESVLFDVPYKQVVSESLPYNVPTTNGTNEEQSNAPKQERNPALPADIDTKTFSGSEDAEKDLNQMIGLGAVKEQITKMKNRIQFYGSTDVGGGGNHMVFMGSAGVGKTTISRIITKIMYDFGYIKENKCVEISGDYLKSPYTGQTGERTNAIVEYAMGGVLFIDEAYLLYTQGDSASQEATGVLLKAMEDHRKDIIIILAGYEEQMTKLLASNEGFNSRIKYKIYFPDYTVEEMYEIFTHFINHFNGNNVYLVEDSAKELLLRTFELEKQSKSFGNARTVRNAVDAIMDNYADRCITEGDKSNVIKYQDVALYTQSRENELQHELRNASATNQIDESIIRLSELKNKVKEGSANPDQDFREMIGLETFADEINLLKSQKDFFNESKSQNVLFVGPDGCGKTSLTRILTGYLYQYGYIKDNRYLEISAEFLKGSYIGHTSRRAESIISYASGGVLYIKNIHLLTNSDNDNFAQEALSAIITALNTNNNVCIVISDIDGSALYNYQNLFSIIYAFPTYEANDLLSIFNLNAQKDGFTVAQETFNKLFEHLQTKQLSCRDLIQLYNNTKKNHINNFSKGITTDKFTISPADLDTNKPKLKLNLK